MLEPLSLVPRWHLGNWASDVVDWLTKHMGGFFDGLASVINNIVDQLADGLLSLPIVLMIVVLAALAFLSRGWKLALAAVIGWCLIDSLNAWAATMQTLALVLIASLIAIVVSIPFGILAARSRVASSVIKPVLDFMQTLPAFVYLLPMLFLFGIGSAPAILSTIVFAIPPGVRLTELGIRQVDSEMVEAGHAFGATPREVLRGIQFPLALPTIMAGVNQVIMLSLSMVVIGALVGAQGLGSDVVSALQTIQVGPGVEAGVAVVILAIYLDRVTAGFGQERKPLFSSLLPIKRNPMAEMGNAMGVGGGSGN